MKILFTFSILMIFSSFNYASETGLNTSIKEKVPALIESNGESILLIDFLKKDRDSHIFKQTMYDIERFKECAENKISNNIWYRSASARFAVGGLVGTIAGGLPFIHIPVLVGSTVTLGYQQWSWHQNGTNLRSWDQLFRYLIYKSPEQIIFGESNDPQPWPLEKKLILNTFLISKIQNFSLSFDQSCIVQLDLHE